MDKKVQEAKLPGWALALLGVGLPILALTPWICYLVFPISIAIAIYLIVKNGFSKYTVWIMTILIIACFGAGYIGIPATEGATAIHNTSTTLQEIQQERENKNVVDLRPALDTEVVDGVPLSQISYENQEFQIATFPFLDDNIASPEELQKLKEAALTSEFTTGTEDVVARITDKNNEGKLTIMLMKNTEKLTENDEFETVKSMVDTFGRSAEDAGILDHVQAYVKNLVIAGKGHPCAFQVVTEDNGEENTRIFLFYPGEENILIALAEGSSAEMTEDMFLRIVPLTPNTETDDSTSNETNVEK